MFKKLIALTILISIIFNFNPSIVLSETATEIKNQISDINEQIEELDKEIAEYKNKIAKTSEEANSLSKIIQELTLTKSKLLKERTQIEKKISVTGLFINELSGEIETKEDVIKNSKESISRTIYDLYQNDEKKFIEILLSQNNVNDVSREYNNKIALSDKLKEQIYELTGQKEELTKTKAEKLDEQDKLTSLKQALLEKEKAVSVTQSEKNKILTETKNKESEYQKILTENQKRRDEFEKALSDYESKLQFILNPSLLPEEGSAVLSWPLDYVYITQLFGVTSSSKRLYKSGSHSGVDFRASIGTEVKAMASGVVVGTGDTDVYCKGASFGKWVLIKYDNGLSSTYGHLSYIYAKKGDKVKAGTVVALSGNTGHTTGPHLHVTVYASDGVKIDNVPSISCSGKVFVMPIAASTSYLDPMLYLPAISKDKIKQ